MLIQLFSVCDENSTEVNSRNCFRKVSGLLYCSSSSWRVYLVSISFFFRFGTHMNIGICVYASVHGTRDLVLWRWISTVDFALRSVVGVRAMRQCGRCWMCAYVYACVCVCVRISSVCDDVLSRNDEVNVQECRLLCTAPFFDIIHTQHSSIPYHTQHDLMFRLLLMVIMMMMQKQRLFFFLACFCLHKNKLRYLAFINKESIVLVCLTQLFCLQLRWICKSISWIWIRDVDSNTFYQKWKETQLNGCLFSWNTRYITCHGYVV